jgi:hypothetical protein
MEAAAVLAHTTVRSLYRSVEEGKLHSIESSGGATFVCIASVKALATSKFL